METYLGVKIVEAKPQLRGESAIFEGSKNQAIKSGVYNEPGYKVVYEDGYVSWSPKEVFEKAYRKVAYLTFGLAIEALKLGFCVSRKGWHKEGMFVCKQIPSEIPFEIVSKIQSLPNMAKEILLKHQVPNGTMGIKYRNQLLIISDKVADSWSPSSTDIFAEDWYVIN